MEAGKMVLGIQIFGILFGLFMIYITFLSGKRREFTTKEGGFWILVWVGFMLITIFPNSLDFLVKGVLKLQRPLDFFIIAGFMFMIGFIFYSYTLIRKIQKKTEEIVRKMAIEKK